MPSFQMILHRFILLFSLLGSSTVLAINYPLSQAEEVLLYSRLKSPLDVDSIYRILLGSNRVDNPKLPQKDLTKRKCFQSSKDLLDASNISSVVRNESFSREDLRRLLPMLADMKLNDACFRSDGHGTWKNIFIGFLAVTLINCSAFGGAIIFPFRKKPAFKWILCAFIGLAVGTLTGSGIFHLIPMAFNIPHLDLYHSYLSKALLTMIIIYLYYIRDQLLSIFFNVDTIIPTHSHGEDEASTDTDRRSLTLQVSPNGKTKSVRSRGRTARLIQNLQMMKAAGWMVFIGDMLHNFIDGLTLGAAFMVSISEGLRMTLPILCEEFPHELGDIAVLLSSGLSISQAVFINFLAACSCYLGFFVGAKLGELEEFHPWIYALAGGMFVYIGLTDMVPELISMGKEVEMDYRQCHGTVSRLLKWKIFLCQNSGVFFGVSIMFLLGRYGEYLEQLVQF